MTERRRVLLLFLVLAGVAIVVTGFSMFLLYRAAFKQQSERLVETAQSQARLIEAMARHDLEHQQKWHQGVGVPAETTLNQIRDAHDRYQGLGQSGEFTLARLAGDQIVFLLSHRHQDHDLPRPVAFDSPLAEPMRRALRGESGTVVGLDYRGATVLAAYEPVGLLGMGIVAKIDLVEIRAPFLWAGLSAGIAMAVAILLGSLLFFRLTNPLLAQLVRERNLFHTLMANVPDAIYFKDREARWVHVSDSLARVVGVPAADVIGGTDEDYFDADLAKVKLEDDRKVIETGEPIVDKEEPDAASLGPERWVSTTKLPWRDENGDIIGLFGVSRDITARKRMERERIRTQRLRAAGELSAGVSHNLNNILTSVLGPAQLIKRMCDEPEVLKEADEILAAANRARELVHRLHLSTQITRDEALSPVPLNDVIREAITVTKPRWQDEAQAEGISLKVTTDLANAPVIRGTESGLFDLFVNLLLNAIDAMPLGGAIQIATRQVGDSVIASVADTGMGMDDETRARMFEPFFTTKSDVGSGLGLATVHNTVTRWGGTIDVTSVPGTGATFTVRFPVCTGDADPAAGPPAGPEAVRRARILVVEDDTGVSRFLTRLLEDDHEVTVAPSAENALGVVKGGSCDVALVDQGLPDTPGDRLADQIRRLDPAVALVLITGWEIGEGDARLSRFDLAVKKPFDDLDQLLTTVAHAIRIHDQRSPAQHSA